MNRELMENAAQALNNERFKLILYPTERCNFRCLYCYEDHRGSRMQRHLVESIKKFLSQKIPLLKLFELEWFGGEPLLTKDIVIEITEFAQKLCIANNVVFVSVMTTNGYLLDYNTFDRLVGIGINSFQITFDGDKPNHDRYRLLANKSSKGTFDTIWNNLLETKKMTNNLPLLLDVI